MMPGNLLASQIVEKYGNRLRIRVSGLCWRGDELLMVNHRLSKGGNFWAPPGGGIDFGQSAHEALVREFQEETRVTIKPGRMLFTCELLKPPLHAIELFFEAVAEQGEASLGTDPESAAQEQIIQEVRYLEFASIMALQEHERHGIFRFVKTTDDLKNLNGFYRI
jgi:8-oxo-dGTP diphosphatase